MHLGKLFLVIGIACVGFGIVPIPALLRTFDLVSMDTSLGIQAWSIAGAIACAAGFFICMVLDSTG